MLAPTRSRGWWSRMLAFAALSTISWCAAQGQASAQISDAFAWPNTDFDKRLVDLGEIQSGGPPKDGIPPIDAPEFVSTSEASEWLDPREPVIVVEIDGEAKSYPIQILTWHEIVNDELAGRPISVTFCPLCNASIVFDRRVDGQLLDFGTTGKLRKSDLVMYDRQSESWWQQFTGRAIVGELTGTVLERFPAKIVAYEDYVAAYPDGPVLSRDTGHRRAYGTNPYRGYDSADGHPFLFFDPVDERLPAMERVLSVSVDERHKLYPFASFSASPVVNDEFEGVPVVVMSKRGTLSALDEGEIAASREIPSATAFDRRLGERTLTFEATSEGIRDEQTGSRWDLLGRAVSGPLEGERLRPLDAGVHFAFAWLAFRPDSAIYAP